MFEGVQQFFELFWSDIQPHRIIIVNEVDIHGAVLCLSYILDVMKIESVKPVLRVDFVVGAHFACRNSLWASKSCLDTS